MDRNLMIKQMMENFDLTEDQRKCVDLLVKFKEDKKAKYFILGGFGGSGKSFLVSNFVRKLFPSIQLTATTHKACEAINKTLGSNEAITIHSHLGLQLKREDHKQVLKKAGDSDYKQPVLIDECSMIDDELFAFIDKCEKVIFVGDPAQLPPVNSTTISKSFMVDTEYKVFLEKIVRQAEGNPIIMLSKQIRESKDRFDFYSLLKFDSNIYLTSVDDDTIAQSMANAINGFKDIRYGCYTNRRVIQMNNLIHKKLYGDTKYPFERGERVVFNEMYEYKEKGKEKREFRNNEECTVVNIKESDEEHVILVALQTEKKEIIDDVKVHLRPDIIEREVKLLFDKWFKNKDRDALNDAWYLKTRYAPLRHCYAMTIHRAQGSTFDIMVVDLADLNRMRDDSDFNKCAYVAVTRPRETLVINSY